MKALNVISNKNLATTNDHKILFFLLTFYDLGFVTCIIFIHPTIR